MSRICVKNLPKHVVEDRLREHFSRKGEVTDAKLMRTRDGKTRQFAFIGYQTEQEAEEAIKYFNNSYMDTFRITCETAYKFNDPNLRMPWSRHSAKKQEAMEKEKNKLNSVPMSKSELKKAKKKKKNKENVVVADPLLQEFLQVTQPRSKSKLWANDTTPTDRMGKAIGKAEVQLAKRDEKETGPVHDGLEGNEEEENVFVKKSLEKRSKPEDVVIARDEVLSDMDYLKSRIKKDWSDSEDEEDGSLSEGSVGQVVGEVDVDEPGEGDLFQVEGDADEPVEQNENESGESENVSDVSKQVLETGRLFVRNLPYTASEDDLADHFSKFGNLSQVHLVLDKGTKRSKGIAYVLYELPESALRALEELDNSTFQGRLLHIMPAQQPISSEKQKASAASIQASKSFKQQREDRRKASEAGGDTRAWNSLFMRPDTVVEHVARKYGVSKSELLDREGDDLAVRIALGETQVIAETKKALENSGVNVAALEELTSGKTDTLKRSTHVILVKNLPYGSSEGDLADMFGKFGSLEKIVPPSTKTLALVVFLEPTEARAAFRGLAYKRYKDAPLYLEWAPSNILSLTSKSEKDAKNNDVVGEQEVKRVLLEQRVEEISEVDFDPDRVESRSLFVKNLNFKTSDESLRKHFSEHMKEGSICSAKVKKHVKNGKSVSMGFGFVEFDSVETAKNICRDMQGMILDGHALILQLCHAKKDEHMQKKVDKDKSTTKLIVRNVAFEATEKDLRQLFMPFGQVKSLRLPMKFGNHRGFAFVEFVTKQEAQNALRALSNTHLYGRHLVLERAKEGESLEELRARTASQFTNEENGFQNPIKLSKKRKQLDILDESNVKFSRIAG